MTSKHLEHLRAHLERLEDRLISQGDNPSDGLVRLSHRLRAEIAKASEPVIVQIGDTIEIGDQPFLVDRVNYRTFTGRMLYSGKRCRIAKTFFMGVVLRRSNRTAPAAVERHKTSC